MITQILVELGGTERNFNQSEQASIILDGKGIVEDASYLCQSAKRE